MGSRALPRNELIVRLRPIKIFCAGFLIVALATGFSATATSAETVFTADEKGGSVSAIDLATGRVSTVRLAMMPHNVQISSDGKQLVAVGMSMTKGGKGRGAHDGGKFITLDTTVHPIRPIGEIDVGPHPAHVIMDRAGKLAFVTDSQENAVLVVDLVAQRISGRIVTGAYPHGLRLSPDGLELYVANVKGGTVSVIDVAKQTEIARIDVGKSPVQVGFTPDGHYVFVSLNGEGKVAAINRGTRRVVAKIPVGRNPVQVYATPDGRHVYVANQGTEKRPGNTVSVISVDVLKPVATITAGKGAHGVVVSDDGKSAFISNIVDGTVSAIDTSTQKVGVTYQVGAGPNGISYRRSD